MECCLGTVIIEIIHIIRARARIAAVVHYGLIDGGRRR
jgi:hypothetical protein